MKPERQAMKRKRRAMKRRRLIIKIVVISFVLAIIAAWFIGIPTFIGTPDAVHIVVSKVQLATPPDSIPAAGPPGTKVIFDHQFTRQASAIYQQIVSGERITTGSSCPISATGQPYYHYVLTFFHLGMQVAQATVDAIDCMDISVVYPGGRSDDYFWRGSNGVSFWIRLYQLTYAPEPIGICVETPGCPSLPLR